MLFAGFLFDITGNYRAAFVTAGVAIASAGVICLPLRCIHRRNIHNDAVSLYKEHSRMEHRTSCEENAVNKHMALVVDTDSNSTASVQLLENEALHDYQRNRASSRRLLGSHQYIGSLNPYSTYDTESLLSPRAVSESHSSVPKNSDAKLEAKRKCRSELSLRSKVGTTDDVDKS